MSLWSYSSSSGVPISCKYTLSHTWTRNADTTFDSNGQLIAWELKEEREKGEEREKEREMERQRDVWRGLRSLIDPLCQLDEHGGWIVRNTFYIWIVEMSIFRQELIMFLLSFLLPLSFFLSFSFFSFSFSVYRFPTLWQWREDLPYILIGCIVAQPQHPHMI